MEFLAQMAGGMVGGVLAMFLIYGFERFINRGGKAQPAPVRRRKVANPQAAATMRRYAASVDTKH